MFNTPSCILLLSALAALPLSAASAQTIVNGDFSLAVPSNGAGNGWSSDHIDWYGGWRENGGRPGGRFILNDDGNGWSDPTLSQTINSLVVGAKYHIAGEYQNVYNGGTGQAAFLVLMGGETIFTGTASTLGQWRSFAADFTANATSMLLELHGEAFGTDRDFAVDNIAIGAFTPPCGPADVGKQGGIAGADTQLNNNDFIVFIEFFFDANPLADRGQQGGVAGSDGAFDNNDFVVFIDQFFAGC